MVFASGLQIFVVFPRNFLRKAFLPAQIPTLSQLLLTENHSFCSGIHRLYYCKRFELISKVSYTSSAVLEALFNNDTDSLNGSARCLAY